MKTALRFDSGQFNTISKQWFQSLVGLRWSNHKAMAVETGKTVHFVPCWGFGSSLRRSFGDSFSTICAGQMLSLPSVLSRSSLLPHGSCKICHCCIRPPDQGQMGRGAFLHLCVRALACVCSLNLADNTWTVSLSVVGARYMWIWGGVGKVMHCQTDAGTAPAPQCGARLWQHANAAALRPGLSILKITCKCNSLYVHIFHWPLEFLVLIWGRRVVCQRRKQLPTCIN